ncbi:hypothetical protein HU200_009555 [Digitaria exilis]|uniref:Derlin n=1 Tax=Digitaria exilis TaxID=1010633 RepID=A0A835KSJ4_9POAL|nr:hypothetical protein HU200_009555 [Digitaria exilis]
MAQAVEEWYRQMPIITRSYLTAAVVTTVGCTLEVPPASPDLPPPPRLGDSYLQLLLGSLFNRISWHPARYCAIRSCARLTCSPPRRSFRPITSISTRSSWCNTTRSGASSPTSSTSARWVDLDFLFHMFFLARYCKLLEENSFRGRTADFFYMLLFGATALTGIVLIGGMIPYVSETFARILFLSNSLTFMMVYVWSKHNPFIHMSFLGLFTFTAAYLPWVLLGFSILVGSSTWVDILGMIAGHVYYFLEDVYPRMTGRRPLKTPSFIKALFADDNVVVARAPNAAVGGAGPRFGGMGPDLQAQ